MGPALHAGGGAAACVGWHRTGRPDARQTRVTAGGRATGCATARAATATVETMMRTTALPGVPGAVAAGATEDTDSTTTKTSWASYLRCASASERCKACATLAPLSRIQELPQGLRNGDERRRLPYSTVVKGGRNLLHGTIRLPVARVSDGATESPQAPGNRTRDQARGEGSRERQSSTSGRQSGQTVGPALRVRLWREHRRCRRHAASASSWRSDRMTFAESCVNLLQSLRARLIAAVRGNPARRYTATADELRAMLSQGRLADVGEEDIIGAGAVGPAHARPRVQAGPSAGAR